MKRRDVVRLADLKHADGPSLTEIGREVRRHKLDPADCRLQALLPSEQPPARLADDAVRNRNLLRHLERRDFRVRPARTPICPPWCCWNVAAGRGRCARRRRS
jgi:hypothetical protein